MFKPEEKSTFKYWFAHWCAFNFCALNLRAWKFKYLFHDMEKPWLKLFLPYEKVRKIHRTHNAHHLEYKGKWDVEAMVIDWECSRFTKEDAPMTAFETYQSFINERFKEGKIDASTHLKMNLEIPPVLKKFGLWKEIKLLNC